MNRTSPAFAALDGVMEQIAPTLKAQLNLDDGRLRAVRRVLSTLMDDDRMQREVRERARELVGEDGELEIDEDAAVSWSSDGGAYIQGWVWIYDDDLFANRRRIVLELETANGICGSCVYLPLGDEVVSTEMRWDANSTSETIRAQVIFKEATDTSVAVDERENSAMEIAGDEWREMEDSGQFDQLVKSFLLGNGRESCSLAAQIG